MRKSRSETAETRARIVSVASRIFLERGLNSVGMRDVMEAAELTAGGFYRHFSSKDHLVTEAIGAAFDRLFAMFEEETRGKSPGQALKRIVTLYLEQSANGAGDGAPYLCPLAQLGSELRRSSPAVRAVAFKGRQRLEVFIVKGLAERPKRDASRRASSIVDLLVGAVTSANLAPPEVAAQTLAEAKKTIIVPNISKEDA